LKEDEPSPAQDKPFGGAQFGFLSDNYQLAMLLGM